MTQLFWVPLVVLEYFVIGFLTVKNNNAAGWSWLLWISGALPIWPLISRYSKDVVFDGLVFDICMTVTYTLTVFFLTKSFAKFSLTQYIGLSLILSGLFLFRKGF